jgi:Tol biopolymer transport system component
MGPGSRVGVYEIGASIGAGGMGEVFRARDTRLARDVAIKFLPDLFAYDPDRLARFEREARSLAALNHPHIAQIHGIEESAGVHALVMELVEGPTLADRLAAGPIAIAETIHIARQMADALECAHERGIVHRDLKPANVKVREDGTVKVLDFGLAKASEPSGVGSGPLANSPTFTSPAMTERGLILGTAAYMAPEQARGKVVDHRADIWAFGVIVFEMLAGKQLFAGETVSDTLAAVLREEIAWTALPPIPAALRRMLERCLQKDPKRRLHSIADARFDLDEAAAVPAAGVAAPLPAARPWPARLGWIAAAILGAVAAIATWTGRHAPPAEARWQQFTQVTDIEGEESWPSISPDGKSVAYASAARGTSDIYVQRVGGRNPALVAGDPEVDESGPAFAPDGQTIAFHQSRGNGGIFLTGATGESSRRLTDFGFHPAWSPDGTRIAFSTEELLSPYSRGSNSSLWVVEVAGGAPRKIDDGDAAQPAWSPSGARIAFWAVHGGQRDLYTVPAGGGARVPVLEDAAVDWSPAWSPDGRYLYFSSDRGGAMNLWRMGIDEASGRAHGSPEPVTAGVQASLSLPSLSRDGSRLAFRARLESSNPMAVPLDPATAAPGIPVILSARNGVLQPSDVSPDGRRLLLDTTGDRQEDILIGGVDGSAFRRLTDDAPRDRMPRFLPDGKSILFYSNRDGRWKIWSIRVDGGGLHLILGMANGDLIYPLQSPNADRLVSTSLQQGPASYLSELRGGTAGEPRKLSGLTVDRQTLVPTDWSRDGRRLAGFVTADNGSPLGVAVYDMTSGAMTVVSRDETAFVRWLPDSRRVVYVEQTRHQLVVVDVDTRSRVATTVKSPLSLAPGFFAVAPDGHTVYVGGQKTEADIWIVERR